TATADTRAAPVEALLAAITPLAPAPWTDQPTSATVEVVPPRPRASASSPVPIEQARSLAQALWRGGAAGVPDRGERTLPALLATLETWLPDEVRAKPRTG